MATAVEIGVCCDSATCFSNATHFPGEDAQAVCVYLVTPPPTFYSCALPRFSLHCHRTRTRVALGDCWACARGGLSAPQHRWLSPTFRSQPSKLPQHEPQAPASLSKSFLTTCCMPRMLYHIRGVKGPLHGKALSPQPLRYLELCCVCSAVCLAKEMPVSGEDLGRWSAGNGWYLPSRALAQRLRSRSMLQTLMHGGLL